ncbi:MAG: hypothetical protein ABJB55_00155 [Actinomycetota bacterium]
MEPLRPTPDQAAIAQMGVDLERIEAAVAAGDRDLRSLGFWKVIGAIKRDRAAIVRHADQAGRIDTAAFRAGVRTRVRPWIGVVGMLVLSAAGVVGVALAATWTDAWAGLALLGAGVAWSIGWHLPAHAFVGWLAGIRYTDAFLGGPPPPRPGIKTDYATYLKAEPSMRAWFHASGAIATKLAPFVALALWPSTNAPMWSAWALLAVGAIQIGTDVTLSTKSSDWKKFRRERTVAKNLQRSYVRPKPG